MINLTNATDAICLPGADTKSIRKDLQNEAFNCFKAARITYRTLKEMRDRRGDLMKNGKIDGVGRSGGSSWQSLQNNRPDNEVDYLNGEIVQLGRLYNISVPTNIVMQNLMKRMTQEGIEPRSIGIPEIKRLIARES